MTEYIRNVSVKHFGYRCLDVELSDEPEEEERIIGVEDYCPFLAVKDVDVYYPLKEHLENESIDDEQDLESLKFYCMIDHVDLKRYPKTVIPECTRKCRIVSQSMFDFKKEQDDKI
jgi:hypothetical protein